ncbi:phosphatidylinositol transfer protein csr1 [Moniliophthora roreri MCA 2997]|uniref:Phosphatidylinositol transfer protein csr1 n=2 Tax=Moniliophthora roreri TaxID=221103 RepID=V2XAT8_MONRO|nr:phosphatidylinositol transfer protein csr1 [Moniliophthora roreri MCA 2997]
MDIRELLQVNCDRLLNQYEANLEGALDLQSILIDGVLPSVTDELELDEEQTDWTKEWLEDTQAIFQIMRKHKFTRSFAMDSIRKNIVWRIEHLWPPKSDLHIPELHCLPDVRDPLGRPILVIEPAALNGAPDAVQPLFIHAMERLRVHLKVLNDASDKTSSPSLQYIVLLDLQKLSMQTMSIELFSWFLKELIPRFPGMLAAVFMLNFSWSHYSIWSVARRILPASAVSRVFFPSQTELNKYFTPSSLPKDYGGDLAALSVLNNALESKRVHRARVPEAQSPEAQSQATANSESSDPSSGPTVSIGTRLSPTSANNPFFGYPASFSSGSSTLHHGRKRKRDLVRTLLILLWRRWHRHVSACLWLVVVTVTVRQLFSKRIVYSSAGAALLRGWWTSAFAAL